MDFKILNKGIIEYLIRLICFIVTIKFWFIQASFPVMILYFPIIILTGWLLDFLDYICRFNTYTNSINELEDISKIVSIIAFFTLYFLAKIFGIFKKLNRLNIFVSLIIISIISYVLILIGKIDFLVNELTYEEGLEYSYTMYFLIPAFMLYKLFGYMTKKFPFPFEKIGYYTSIEFFKELYKKFMNKIKSK